ncbi:MAG: pyruvate carboxyltransferase [Verrucomicrobia bacterium]|nr:pyruvate carboxyltransferase [Verrucomicrobiota bacterium]
MPELHARVLDEGPDYLPDQFPRAGFPRYAWIERPASLPLRAWTTETTHRDGQQGGLPLTPEQSLDIYDLLCRFTGTSGAIRQAEFFVYRKQDLAAFRAVQEKFAGGAPIEPTTWIRATVSDAGKLRELGVGETGLLASISDYHVFHKFTPGGRRPAANHYLDAVQMALDAGVRPRLHLEDATRAPIDYVLYFVQAVLAKAQTYPAALQPKFRVCDTLGLGLPDPDVAPPRGVPALFARLKSAGIDSEALEFHPHNDTGLVVANCLAAVRSGCAVINGTCLAKGERTGNAPLEQVLLHLCGMGYFAGKAPDFTVLNRLAELYARLGDPIPAKYPLYGRDAHRTRAGIHADGLNKFWWMYAPFDVPQLLGRPLEVSITKDSGAAGLVFLVRQHLGFDLAKNAPEIQKALAWALRQFEDGRQTAIEWEELKPFFPQDKTSA